MNQALIDARREGRDEITQLRGKLSKAFSLWGEIEDAPGADATFFRRVYELTGDHMILTDEGWAAAENRAELVEKYGEEAILDEVNRPEPSHVEAR